MDAKRGFNLLAKNYDNILNGFFNKYVEIPAIKKNVKRIKNKRVLDIGCATGTHSKILQEKGAIVYGVDISKEMIKLAKIKFPNINFKIADMKDLPFKDDYFDFLFYGLCIHYEKNLNVTFKEARRVLKKGGKIIISTHNPDLITNNPYFPKKKVMPLGNVEIEIFPRRTRELIDPLLKNGFKLIRLSKPLPLKKSKVIDKRDYALAIKNPPFVVIEAKKR